MPVSPEFVVNPTPVTSVTASGLPCAACGQLIYEKFLCYVLDKAWHELCIRCVDCQAPLALDGKCYTRHGQLYCKDDFFKRFATRCSGCQQPIRLEEYVRRAKDKYFHVDCLKCSACCKQLETGEALYVVSETGNVQSRFYCKTDYTALQGSLGLPLSNELSSHDDEDHDEDTPLDDLRLAGEFELREDGTEIKSEFELGGEGLGLETSAEGMGGQKRRGPRTTIKAKQLETLKAAFAATPKPTRHIREQLAQQTGLNMRVIQVWFQNRRSKERRMKQMRYPQGFRPTTRRRGGGSANSTRNEYATPTGVMPMYSPEGMSHPSELYSPGTFYPPNVLPDPSAFAMRQHSAPSDTAQFSTTDVFSTYLMPHDDDFEALT